MASMNEQNGSTGDGRPDNLSERLDQLEHDRIAKLEQRLEEFDARFDKLERVAGKLRMLAEATTRTLTKNPDSELWRLTGELTAIITGDRITGVYFDEYDDGGPGWVVSCECHWSQYGLPTEEAAQHVAERHERAAHDLFVDGLDLNEYSLA